MAKSVTKFSIFLSSPGDVKQERGIVDNVINELNITYGNKNGIIFDLLKWESHSAPAISDRYSQNIINKDIGDEYDLFIGILWQRFGTKTEMANSGTEEELLRAINRYKKGENIQILFYFKNMSPSNLSEINLDDLKKVRDFQEMLKDENILYFNFLGVDEFATYLRSHIPLRIESLISHAKVIDEKPILLEDKKEVTSTVESGNTTEEFGLYDYLEQFEKHMVTATEAMLKIAQNTTDISIKIQERTEEFNALAEYPKPNIPLIIETFGKTSKNLDLYAESINRQSSIFFTNFKKGMDSCYYFMDILVSVNENEAEILLNSMTDLKANIIPAISGQESFYNRLSDIPNFQNKFNKSKNKVKREIKDIITYLNESVNMINNFITEYSYNRSKEKN